VKVVEIGFDGVDSSGCRQDKGRKTPHENKQIKRQNVREGRSSEWDSSSETNPQAILTE
jgi:hypothetical protein